MFYSEPLNNACLEHRVERYVGGFIRLRPSLTARAVSENDAWLQTVGLLPKITGGYACWLSLDEAL